MTTRFTKLSKAAASEDGVLRCPKCNGAQFKARRTDLQRTVGIVTVGVGALLMPKKQVQCETCGAKFRRG
jgi:hypothetical protein